MGTIYVGMDIHKNFIQAVAMDEQGKVLREQRFGSDGMEGFIKGLDAKDIKAAIESTCTWYHVYDTLESLGVDTTLVNTRRTKVIAEAKIKTDKLDALSIAHCLRTGFIARAWVPSKEVREFRNIVRHRICLRRDITRAKNRVHSILLRNGIKHEFSDVFGKVGMEFLKSLELKGSEKYRMESYIRIVESLLGERNQVTKKIEMLCKEDDQAMIATKLKGISYYSAMAITSEIGDFKRFPNPKKLCSYAGLVPRTIQSGGKVYHGKIIKECNHNLKWILIQCVHVHVRHCPNSPITRLYYRVMVKKGKNKAIVAAARKMLKTIWHIIVEGKEFKLD